MSAINKVPLDQAELALILRALGAYALEFSDTELTADEAIEVEMVEELDNKLWAFLASQQLTCQLTKDN